MPNKEYSIYGNDDQQKLNQILREKDEIYDLVYKKEREEIENRKKNNEKYKNVLDTKRNINPNEKILNDVFNEDFDKYHGKNEDVLTKNDNESAKNDSKLSKITNIFTKSNKDATSSEVQNKEDKPKKSKIKTVVTLVFILLLLAILAFVVIQVINKGKGEKEVVVQTSTKEVVEEITTPEEELNITNKLVDIDEQKEYSLNDSLVYADTLNKGMVSYWKEIIDHIESCKANKESINQKLIKKEYDAISVDIEYLNKYIVLYEPYDGRNYYENVKDRYYNYIDMLKEITGKGGIEFIDEVIFIVNDKIAIENELNEKAKASLIEYMDNNHTEHTEENDEILYKILNVKETEKVNEDVITPNNDEATPGEDQKITIEDKNTEKTDKNKNTK